MYNCLTHAVIDGDAVRVMIYNSSNGSDNSFNLSKFMWQGGDFVCLI